MRQLIMSKLFKNNSLKLVITLVLLFYFSTSFSQWTRVQQLPSADIFSLYHKDNTFYAGGKNSVYLSRDNGQTWDSTNVIPLFSSVNNVIVYKNELYVSSFSIGVYKSSDGGATWQNISAGVFPEVADFAEWRGDLYAATLGSSIFKLDSTNRNNWVSFNNGLSDLSANTTSIAGNSNALIAGTLANGMYDYMPANSTVWEERFLLGQIRPTEGTFDIITVQDSLFLAGFTGRFYISTDNGLNWNFFSQPLPPLPTTSISIVNAKQALLTARSTVNNGLNNTTFYYLKKNSPQFPFVEFSFVPDHFTFKLDIVGDKIWDASTKGLFYMSLSDLPGITNADNSVTDTPLPMRFILFTSKCEGNKVQVTWKTAQEQNSSHFNIERSPDDINWTVIGKLPASRNSNTENSYSFTDNNPGQNGYYRIAGYDLDGRVQYSGILRSSCIAKNLFLLWPNPVGNMAVINIITSHESQAVIRVFDSKGALIKVQRATVLQGSNQLNVDMRSLASGVYSLSVEWNNGQMKKAIQVLKR